MYYCTVCCSLYTYALTEPSFWSHLRERGVQGDCDTLRDVSDGWEYLRHKHFVGKPEHVTFLLNTDGVSLYRSSSISLWPIWLAVNELPPHIRYVDCTYSCTEYVGIHIHSVVVVYTCTTP